MRISENLPIRVELSETFMRRVRTLKKRYRNIQHFWFEEVDGVLPMPEWVEGVTVTVEALFDWLKF